MERDGFKSGYGQLQNPKRRHKGRDPRRVRVVNVTEASAVKIEQTDKADNEADREVAGGKIQRPFMSGVHWLADCTARCGSNSKRCLNS